MEASRYLSCLQHDAARLRAVAADHLDARVPSCPGWTVADLLRHVAEAYQHKTQSIRLGAKPQPWPPDLSGEEPIPLFDRSLADLLAEFEAHDSADHAWTWYPADQSVGFWLRRMTQETVIHRVDGELATDEVTAIPEDLAVDGIDEVLSIFLGWDSFDTLKRAGPEGWPGLEKADGRVIQIASSSQAWSVRPTPAGVEVSAGGTPDAAAATTGDPSDLLLWLWRRGDGHRLTVEGDRALVDYLQQQMAHATQ